MLMDQASGFRSLRAPQGDGQTVIEPPLDALPRIVAANRDALAAAEYDIQGRSLAALSASARHTLFEKALEYTLRYRDVPDHFRHAAQAGAPYILAGHQPQLFHPGVWYKNFVLGSLSRQLSAVPVHLLIDSDLCRGASIRVPSGAPQSPHLEAVHYDEPAAEVPYEERTIGDFGAFTTFAERALAVIRPLVPNPLLSQLWPLVLDRDPSQTNLGLRIAQGRHALEATWHNNTLELPQSIVCQMPEFAWFVAHVLAHLPRFWSAYNDALADYRRAHRMRSRAHPVPDLSEVEGWLEAPFWIWTGDDPRRRPLFAQQSGDELLITDRQTHTFRLSLTAERDAEAATQQLLDIASRGVKIRTRALTTTLFARILLSDLFLHGIGGAKYDQVTDQIARSFFGFEPPEFAAVSATLRLPVPAWREEIPHDSSCAQALRDLRYHPERHIGDGAADDKMVQEIVARKQRWLDTEKSPANAHERHLDITAANEALQPFVAAQRHEIKRRCDALRQQKRAAAILQSREYAFCLFPQRHFESLLNDL